MKKRKPLSPDELKAYCEQHGHSWIKPSYSFRRCCSYCGTYEDGQAAEEETAGSIEPIYVDEITPLTEEQWERVTEWHRKRTGRYVYPVEMPEKGT